MKFNLKTQKNLILIIALVTVIIAGGIFFGITRKNKEELEKPISKNTFASIESYEIIETPGGKIVENKNEGFRINLPDGWRVEKDKIFGTEIYLFDLNVGDNFIKSAKEKGACGMSIEIYKSEKIDSELTTFAEDLKNEITYIEENPEKMAGEERPKNEIILVDNKKGIKRTYLREGQVRFIGVEIPIGQTVYNFSSGFITNQECVEKFYKILETVSIEK